MAEVNGKVKAAVIGASGYTGAEAVRLLLGHERAEITALAGESSAGKEMREVFPHLAIHALPRISSVKDVNWGGVDAAFLCLPHGTTQEVAKAIPERVRIIDVSADFRLHDLSLYKKWYGAEHQAPELQKQAVYGLSEIYREKIKTARLIACPGCYPTSVILPLYPLLEAGLIEREGIIVDSKSGVSGAGRAAKQGSLFSEVNESVHAYAVEGHRHSAEMETELAKASGGEFKLTFVPHLIPMTRGMLSTIYVKGEAGELRAALSKRYGGEAFVKVLPEGAVPATSHARGSNYCLIGVFKGQSKDGAVIVSAIDNLVKGASGQAVQNMNIAFGLEEGLGLKGAGMGV